MDYRDPAVRDSVSRDLWKALRGEVQSLTAPWFHPHGDGSWGLSDGTAVGITFSRPGLPDADDGDVIIPGLSDVAYDQPDRDLVALRIIVDFVLGM